MQPDPRNPTLNATSLCAFAGTAKGHCTCGGGFTPEIRYP